MSLAGVRAAVANYISGASITNLTYVYASQPYDLEDVDWQSLTTPGSTTDAVGIVYIDNDADEVIALDGAGGRREVTYQVSFEVLVWDVAITADPTSTAGQAAYDQIVADLKTRLRTDPQMGTATTPGMAGNGEIIQAAIARLETDYGRPVRLGNGDAWACWFAMRFAVQTYEYST